MPVMRFQLTPAAYKDDNGEWVQNTEYDKKGNVVKQPDISSNKISELLQAAGVNCRVKSDLITGVLELEYGYGGNVDLSPIQKQTARTIIKSMPQYQGDL